MSIAPVQDLRRIADALAHLRERVIQDVSIRSDCRQFRLRLEGGDMLLVSVLLDEAGRPRLDADLLRNAEEPPTSQIEVPFSGGGT